MSNKREELLKERERLKDLEDIMKREAEATFKDFRPKYQYKVTKTDLKNNERVFYRGDEINAAIIRIDIRPAPGVVHDYTGLHLKARKIAPYVRLNLPVLFTIWQTFLVDKEGKIIPYEQSYERYELTLTGRSICIEPIMRIWPPSLKEGEKEKIELFAKMHTERVARIENWIKMGYPENELVWTEDVGIGEIITKES